MYGIKKLAEDKPKKTQTSHLREAMKEGLRSLAAAGTGKQAKDMALSLTNRLYEKVGTEDDDKKKDMIKVFRGLNAEKVEDLPGGVTSFQLKGDGKSPGKRINYVADIPEEGRSAFVRGFHGEPLTSEDIARIDSKHSLKSADRLIQASPRYRGERTFAIGNTRFNPTSLLHELGHATGSERTDTIKHKAIFANRILGAASNVRVGQFKGTSPHSPVIAPMIIAAGMKRKEGETRDEFLDRKQKARHITNATMALPHLPTLIEEARASINAHKLGKKIGVPVNKKQLAAAYGTYLGSAFAPHVSRAIVDTAAHHLDKQS